MVDSKEQFVRKMNDIRTRTLVERDNLTADQVHGEEMISMSSSLLLFCAGGTPAGISHRFYFTHQSILEGAGGDFCWDGRVVKADCE
jgi:hypothetical protein